MTAGVFHQPIQQLLMVRQFVDELVGFIQKLDLLWLGFGLDPLELDCIEGVSFNPVLLLSYLKQSLHVPEPGFGGRRLH